MMKFALTFALLLPSILVAQGQQWSATSDLRIGSLDAPNYSLTNVSHLVVDRQGNIYVAQPQEHTIRVYDAGGRYARSIGRRGNGPGEFQNPNGMGWKGDTLWVRDPRANRITLFDSRGRSARTVSFVGQSTHPFMNYFPGFMLADGSVLAGARTFPDLIPEPGFRGTVPEVRFTPMGEVIDTIAALPLGNQFLTFRSPGGGAAGSLHGNQPFTDHSLRAISPDGSAVVIVERSAARSKAEASFTVRKLSPQGRPVYTRRFRYTPHPIPGTVRDSVIGHWTDILVRKGHSRTRARQAARNALYLPEYLPPIRDVVVGRDGTVWLQREDRGARSTWNVLDLQGQLIATVEFPPAFHLFQADHSTVWGVIKDEDNVPFVVRYKIRPG